MKKLLLSILSAILITTMVGTNVSSSFVAHAESVEAHTEQLLFEEDEGSDGYSTSEHEEQVQDNAESDISDEAQGNNVSVGEENTYENEDTLGEQVSETYTENETIPQNGQADVNNDDSQLDTIPENNIAVIPDENDAHTLEEEQILQESVAVTEISTTADDLLVVARGIDLSGISITAEKVELPCDVLVSYDNNVQVIEALDIKLWDADGNGWQPVEHGQTVNVEIKGISLSDDADLISVVRIDDEVLEEKEEANEENIEFVASLEGGNDGEVTFEADHFTVYAVIQVISAPLDTTWQYDYEYKLRDSSIVLEKYSGNEVDLTVPSYAVIEGDIYTTALEGGVWKDCDSINSIVFNSSNIKLYYESSYMFYGCGNLTNLDVSSFDTSSVTHMEYMFSWCGNLTNLDVSSFDTSSVTHMEYMFYGCGNLTNLDVSSFDTSSTTSMSYMFYRCYGLTSLDVTNFDTSNVVDMDFMFFGCNSLASLDVSNFDTSSGPSMSYMFGECSSLTSLNMSSFNTSSDTFGVRSMDNMFYRCSSLTSLNVSDLDTSGVINMDAMFSGCSSLTDLDVSSFDTSNVLSMNSMFSGCSNLTSLDVSNFDTSSVKDMGAMFSRCSSLASLDVSNFDTSRVINMGSMFFECSSLTSLNVNSFETSNVKYSGQKYSGSMNYMFSGCSSLSSLDLSGFDTSSVTSMRSMFSRCSSLSSLDVSGFDTSNVEYMSSMFSGCVNLTSLDLSGFDTNVSYEMDNMFDNCSGVTVLRLSPKFMNAENALNSFGHVLTILYNGTREQWNGLGYNLKSNIIVLCNDDTIDGLSNNTDSTMFDIIVAEKGTNAVIQNATIFCDNKAYDRGMVSFLADNSSHVVWAQADGYTVEPSETVVFAGGTRKIIYLRNKTSVVESNSAYFSGILTGSDGIDSIEIDRIEYLTEEGFDFSKVNELLGKEVYVTVNSMKVVQNIDALDLYIVPDIKMAFEPNNISYSLNKFNKESVNITVKIGLKLKNNAEIADSVKNNHSAAFGTIDFTLESSCFGFNSSGNRSLSDTAELTQFVKLGEYQTVTSTVYLWKELATEIAETTSISSNIQISVKNPNGGNTNKKGTIVITNLDLQERLLAAKKEKKNISSKAQKAAGKLPTTAILLPPNITELIGNAGYESNVRELLTFLLGEQFAACQLKNDPSIEEKVFDAVIKKLGIDISALDTSSIINTWKPAHFYIKIKTPTYTYGDQIINFDIPVDVGGFNSDTAQYGMGTISYTLDKELADKGEVPSRLRKEGAKGIATNANLGEFITAMRDFETSAIKSAYDKFSGGWNQIADYSVDSTRKQVLNAMNWIYGTSENVANGKLKASKKYAKFSEGLWTIMIEPTKRSSKLVTCHCPMDMYVYDENGQVCGAIVGDKVVIGSDEVTIWTEGDSKYVLLRGEDYDIKLIGNDIGAMTYTIDEFEDDSATPMRTVTYNDVPLDNGKVYHCYVPEQLKVSNVLYAPISEDGNEQQISSDTLIVDQHNKIPVDSFSLSEESLILQIGETAKLSTAIMPTNATYQDIYWLSTDTTIASVDQEGNILAIAAGDAQILAYIISENKDAVCSISVKNVANTPDENNPSEGNNEQPSPGDNSSGQQTSSEDHNNDNQNPNDNASNENGESKEKNLLGIESISLNYKKLTLGKGGKFSLKSIMTPESTEAKLLWKSSNEKIASVNNKGTIKAKKQGTCSITVSTTDGSASATCNLIIKKNPIKIKKVSIKKKALIKEGDSYVLDVGFKPFNATIKSTKFKSSNKKIATVNKKGIIRAKKKGVCTITVTVKDKSGKIIANKCQVTVK